VLRFAGPVTVGLLLLGAEYAVLFSAEGAHLDRLTPAYAAGFLFVGELAFWSIEHRVAAWSDPVLFEYRLGRLFLSCAAAAGLAAVATLDAAAASGTGGVLLESLGVVAVLGSLMLLAVLVRRVFLR
jgi:hypothetical protein